MHRMLAMLNVPLFHVARHGELHVVQDFTMDIELQLRSDDDEAPAERALIAAVHALAAQHGTVEPELLVTAVARHCAHMYAQVAEACVIVRARPWNRLDLAGRPRDRDFVAAPAALVRTARAVVRDERETISAGLQDMQLLSPTRTGDQRVQLMRLEALWTYGWTDVPYDTQWQQVRRVLSEAFAERGTDDDLALALARAVLDETPVVSTVQVRVDAGARHALDTVLGDASPGHLFGEAGPVTVRHVAELQREELTE